MYHVHKKIYLIGFMGSGKSTIAKALEKELAIDAVDLDAVIEEENSNSVSNIFREKGEDHFRNLETQALQALVYKSPLIVSLGGGTPCFNDNMTLINNTGTSIYLSVGAEELVRRLYTEKNKRPLIADAQSREKLEILIKDKLAVREQFYNQAHYKIDNHKTVTEIAQEIIDLLSS